MRLRYANHRHVAGIHDYSFSNDGWITSETSFPIGIGEHCHRMAARCSIVIGSERASHRRANAQRRKIRARDKLTFHAFCSSAEAQAHVVGEAAEHLTEDGIVFAEVAIQRIRHGVPAAVVPVFHASNGEQHKLLRMTHRQQPKQHLIQQTENGSVCTDAECEGKHRHYRKHRRLLQSS